MGHISPQELITVPKGVANDGPSRWQ